METNQSTKHPGLERAERCPRCGHPENWQFRVRVRLVMGSIAGALGAGLVLGFLAGRLGSVRYG